MLAANSLMRDCGTAHGAHGTADRSADESSLILGHSRTARQEKP
jgi:hypothetical protein